MNSYETFKLYRALKFHFHTKYDFHEYRGRMKFSSPEDFANSREKPWAECLAKKYKDKVGNFLLANLSEGNLYIRDLATDECERVYKQWDHRRNSRSYRLTQDLRKLSADIEDELRCDSNSLPRIVRRYIQGEIDKDTLAIFIQLAKCLPRWDEDMKDNMIWNRTKNRIVKYIPFVKIKPQYEQIFLAKYS